MKVTEQCATQEHSPIFICDFSPPRGADFEALERARGLDADFISVAYNPGRAVRIDSVALAYSIKQETGRDVMFSLATRDMNKLALQSHLLGAQILGLENVMVVGGDVFSQRDLERLKDVSDYRPSELLGALAAMNEGTDFRGTNLKTPTDFCMGASIDLGRDVEKEAGLTYRKASSGAQFFLTQPVFSTGEISEFRDAYRGVSGQELSKPVFFGLQVLAKDGIIFSSVPQPVRDDLDKGRDGVDIALELLQSFLDFGVRTIYLVPPIMKGGARDYEAAQRVLEAARGQGFHRGDHSTLGQSVED